VAVGNSLSETVKRAERSVSSLLLACIVCVGVGFAFYWACVRQGAAHRSDAGWFLSIIVAAFIVAGRENLLRRLLWASIPWVVAGFLDMRAVSAAQSVLENPTSQSVFECGVASAEFLVVMFVWIVAYPEAERYIGVPTKVRWTSQTVLFLIGCTIGSYEFRRMLGVFHSPTLSVLDQLHWLQVWVSRSTLILYGLLVGRIALPLSIWWITHRSAPPNRSS
jgi:hypothetical protein